MSTQKPKMVPRRKKQAPARKGARQPKLTDYIAQGAGKFVRMHVNMPKGLHDAVDLSNLLEMRTPVWYDSKTAWHEFKWPGLEEAVMDPAAISRNNAVVNAAINEFMQRCDRIEFHDKQQVDAGCTVAAQRIERVAGVTVIRPVQ